jgi:hypothetical protein
MRRRSTAYEFPPYIRDIELTRSGDDTVVRATLSIDRATVLGILGHVHRLLSRDDAHAAARTSAGLGVGRELALGLLGDGNDEGRVHGGR